MASLRDEQIPLDVRCTPSRGNIEISMTNSELYVDGSS